MGDNRGFGLNWQTSRGGGTEDLNMEDLSKISDSEIQLFSYIGCGKVKYLLCFVSPLFDLNSIFSYRPLFTSCMIRETVPR